MLGITVYFDLISGRRRGLLPTVCRGLLWAAEVPYRWVVQLRNRAYDRGRFRTFWVGVPVISVGNLTLGGTGKTPLVAWLANWYSRQGVRAAILSRGYGAMAGGVNDEARELDLYVPGVLHLQHPDRVLAARQAIEHRKAEVNSSWTTAFNTARLHRDLDIVLLDGLSPFGFGHVFPRGMLREPVSELRRADVVVLSRANYVGSTSARRSFKKFVDALRALWAEVAYSPRHLLNASGKTQPLNLFRRQPVAAFCGIGNPTAFRLTLEECGYRVIAFREFPDHYAYREEDLRAVGPVG